VFVYLKKTLNKIKDYYPQIDIVEINHDKDHIHLLIQIPPKLSVGSVVRIINTNTSQMLNQKFKFLKKVY
jgi:putative transposase